MIDLKKRFTMGLTLMTEVNEYKKLIDEFHPYIREIYFSPPIGRDFQTRSLAHMDEPLSKKKILDILEYAASFDIEGDFLLNSMAVPGNASRLVEIYNEYSSVVPVRKITLINPMLADSIKKLVPGIRINISFNANINSILRLEQLYILSVSDEVVFGRKQMRDFDLIREAKETFGFVTHLLINNGCIFDCLSACRVGGYCDFYFERMVKSGRCDLNEVYAHYSLFPEELHAYYDKPYIDIFKLSTRDSDYPYLRNLLSSYIEGRHREDVHLYGRITAFTRYANLLDFQKVMDYKRRIYEGSDMPPVSERSKSSPMVREHNDVGVIRVWTPSRRCCPL